MDSDAGGKSALERGVRPRAWFCEVDVYPTGKADYLRSTPISEADGRPLVWAPLYDQAALDAAVAAERERWATAARLCMEATLEQLPLALDALRDVLEA